MPRVVYNRRLNRRGGSEEEGQRQGGIPVQTESRGGIWGVLFGAGSRPASTPDPRVPEVGPDGEIEDPEDLMAQMSPDEQREYVMQRARDEAAKSGQFEVREPRPGHLEREIFNRRSSYVVPPSRIYTHKLDQEGSKSSSSHAPHMPDLHVNMGKVGSELRAGLSFLASPLKIVKRAFVKPESQLKKSRWKYNEDEK